ncbi:MAG: helix-turn-helix transcriptional regulator [bacterium]
MNKNKDILNIIEASGISIKTLAEKLGANYTSLNFLLADPNKITDVLKDQIDSIIEEYQSDLNLFKDQDVEENGLFVDSEFQKILGERIKYFAKQKFSTLKELASALNISPQQLHQYTSGKREPGCKILSKLLEIGCDINWLLSGSKISESYQILTLENEIKTLKITLGEISKLIKKFT